MKKLKFNEETKIIEVVEEETKSNVLFTEKRKANITFVLAVFSFFISVVTLTFTYYQKEANQKQADLVMRQFDASKKPLFECSVEQKELYSDEEYRELYQSWLYDNDICVYNQWLKNEDSFFLFDNDRIMEYWEAYDNHDIETLKDITGGIYPENDDSYRDYLSSVEYMPYSDWKEISNFHKKNITLKNIGGYITNAELEVFIYETYFLMLDNDIRYLFALDMQGSLFSKFFVEKYNVEKNNDLSSDTLNIEYEKSELYYREEYKKLSEFRDYIGSADMVDALEIDENDLVFNITSVTPRIYFSISYLDIEQEEHVDWYRYNVDMNNLSYVEPRASSVVIPNALETDGKEYFDACALQTAETLGFNNIERRELLDFDFSYLERAKQKMVSDLKELILSKKSNSE